MNLYLNVLISPSYFLLFSYVLFIILETEVPCDTHSLTYSTQTDAVGLWDPHLASLNWPEKS